MKLVLSYFFSIVKVTLSNVDFVFDTVVVLWLRTGTPVDYGVNSCYN